MQGGQRDRQMYLEFFPDGLDGVPFAPRDLRSAILWANSQPSARLRLTADGISGIMEIYLDGSSHPRWCLWQTSDGRLQFDDLVTNQFALPYATLDMALRFIAQNL
jgi:hypothetical protein